MIKKLEEKIKETKNCVSAYFDLRLASTNTRPEGFKNPFVVDNKKDIDKIINKHDLNLVEISCKRLLEVTGSFTDF
jgi:hypothetical protein